MNLGIEDAVEVLFHMEGRKNMGRICSAILIIALTMGLCACGQSTESTWKEQYDLGVRYLSEGNYEEAIIAFTAAIEIDAKRPEGYTGRGDAYALSGDTAENLAAALADYEAALALDETLADAWLGLADVYIRQGDYDKALEVLREALEKTGNDQSIADKLAEMEGGSFTDSAGNIRRESEYDENRNLIYYLSYAYDSQGRRTSMSSFDAGGTQLGHVDYVYDQAGNQIVGGKTFSMNDGRLCVVEYEYDAAGNRTKLTNHVSDSLDSAVERAIQYTYDGEGNRIREDWYDGQGNLELYETFVYDASGREVKNERYDPDGTMECYWSYEYDGQGNKIRTELYGADGAMLTYYIYSYDDAGNCLSQEYYEADGTLIHATAYE